MAGFGSGFSEGMTTAESNTGTITDSGSIWFDPTLNAYRGVITGSAYSFQMSGDDSDTQNTLDQAYDEGGTGVGAVIVVDGQPVQFQVGGGKTTALAVTGSSVFDVGAAEFLAGLTGSLTQLPGGLSFIEAGSNVTVTSGSNGTITISSTDSDTQNTLDQAYDEGGPGLGAIIVVDQQPVQLDGVGTVLAVTGTADFRSGLSGSLTRLVDGSSYIEAGANISVTSASNGAITIIGNVVNNTLDQAYDQGGTGVGAVITVDGQPVQFAGGGSQALAVTGTVTFGKASAEFSNHLPTIGTDTSFYVSGTIAGSGDKIVLGGDVVLSGVLGVASLASPPASPVAGDIWYKPASEAFEANFGNPDNIARIILPHTYMNIRTMESDNPVNQIDDNVILVDATAAHVTASLPDIANITKKSYTIKKIDSSANNVVIKPFGGDLIENVADERKITTQYVSLSIVASGSGWWIF